MRPTSETGIATIDARRAPRGLAFDQGVTIAAGMPGGRDAEPLIGAALRRMFMTIVGVMTLALSGHAFAATCMGGGQTIPIPFPSTLTIPNNLAVGSAIASVTMTESSLYSCQPSGSSNTSGVAFNISQILTNTGTIYTGGGAVNQIQLPAMQVFATNVPGIGVAVAVQPSSSACSSPSFFDMGGSVRTPGIALPWVGGTCSPTSGNATNGAVFQVVLVKTGPITTGTSLSGTAFQGASVVQSGSTNVIQNSGGQPGVDLFVFSGINIVPPSCTTPDVTVPMGNYQVSAFTGVGSTARQVGFTLAINNCSAGMSSITYTFAAPGGVANAGAGVIKLTSDSTATGIGIQVVDANNVPLKYDGTQYSVSGVTSNPGSYSVQMKAAYYQTAASVTPGTANANLKFTMTYQ